MKKNLFFICMLFFTVFKNSNAQIIHRGYQLPSTNPSNIAASPLDSICNGTVVFDTVIQKIFLKHNNVWSPLNVAGNPDSINQNEIAFGNRGSLKSYKYFGIDTANKYLKIYDSAKNAVKIGNAIGEGGSIYASTMVGNRMGGNGSIFISDAFGTFALYKANAAQAAVLGYASQYGSRSNVPTPNRIGFNTVPYTSVGNTSIGLYSLFKINGEYNTAIGSSAGSLTQGDNNSFLGSYTGTDWVSDGSPITITATLQDSIITYPGIATLLGMTPTGSHFTTAKFPSTPTKTLDGSNIGVGFIDILEYIDLNNVKLTKPRVVFENNGSFSITIDKRKILNNTVSIGNRTTATRNGQIVIGNTAFGNTNITTNVPAHFGFTNNDALSQLASNLYAKGNSQSGLWAISTVGITNPNKALQISFNETNDYAEFRAVEYGTGYKSIVINENSRTMIGTANQSGTATLTLGGTNPLNFQTTVGNATDNILTQNSNGDVKKIASPFNRITESNQLIIAPSTITKGSTTVTFTGVDATTIENGRIVVFENGNAKSVGGTANTNVDFQVTATNPLTLKYSLNFNGTGLPIASAKLLIKFGL